MKILYLSQLVPYPPDAGPKVRSYYTLRYLSQRHEVTLLAFSRPEDRPEALDHLRGFCRAVHVVPLLRSRQRDLQAFLGSLIHRQPFAIHRDRSAGMTERVQDEMRNSKYDYIHSDQLWMAQYIDALGFERLRALKIKTVLDAHNACFQIFQRLAQGERNPIKRLALEREWRLLRRYEARLCRQIDQLVTVSEEDRRTLEGLEVEALPEGRQTGLAIPICVDLEALQKTKPQPEAGDVLHLGTMFWMPNVEGVEWFINKVWPLVRQRAPEAKFTVVGRRPPASLLRLTAGDRSVQVTGYVDDPRPFLERCAAFIVPLFSGSGMRVKIVEAWARGLPVVSTSVGAEGLQFIDGENILIADGSGDFASAVCRLLKDRALNARLRENGRRWVEERYDWRKIYPKWDMIYGVKPVIEQEYVN